MIKLDVWWDGFSKQLHNFYHISLWQSEALTVKKKKKTEVKVWESSYSFLSNSSSGVVISDRKNSMCWVHCPHSYCSLGLSPRLVQWVHSQYCPNSLSPKDSPWHSRNLFSRLYFTVAEINLQHLLLKYTFDICFKLNMWCWTLVWSCQDLTLSSKWLVVALPRECLGLFVQLDIRCFKRSTHSYIKFIILDKLFLFRHKRRERAVI